MARTKIVLSGEGGQGVQSVAKILVEAGYEANKEVLYIPNFGVEQRGGVSIAFCQLADEKIGEPRFSKGDIVIMLSDRAINRCGCYVDSNSTVIYDSSSCSIKPEFECKRIIDIPAHEIAHRDLSVRVFNIIILGVIIASCDVVSLDFVKSAMEHSLGKKFDSKPHLRDLNYRALDCGMELVKKAGV